MPEFHGSRLVLNNMEVDLLRNLTSEYRTLLQGGRIDRGDPIYDRLFPSAYESAHDEAAYRDLIGDDLAKHKLEALDVVTAALKRKTVDIEDDDFDAWIQTITDLRLAIGTRLEVDEERMAADPDPRDPDAVSLQVLHWLGWITEGLLAGKLSQP